MPLAWPEDDIQHELRSIRMHLATHSLAPDEIKLLEFEGSFTRPSIYINLVTSRVEQDGQFHFYKVRTIAVTYYTEHKKEPYAWEEAMSVASWFENTFERGTIGSNYGQGPLIPIYDFSDAAETDPVLTTDWIQVDQVSVRQERDEDGLRYVVADIRYRTEFDAPEPLVPDIEEVIRTFTLQT